MIWIEADRNETIPKELLYPGWQTDKDKYGKTPLMMWIRYRYNRDIPEELYYDGC